MAEQNLPTKILVVDDDQTVLNGVENMLKSYKINVMKAVNWENALYLFNQNKFDACIVELELADMSGTALIQKWKNHENEVKRRTPFIISSGAKKEPGDESLIKELMDVATISKPFKIGPLLSVLSNTVTQTAQTETRYNIINKVIEPLIRTGNKEKAIAIAKEKLLPLGIPEKMMVGDLCIDLGYLPDAFEIVKGLHEKDQTNMHYINALGKIKMMMGELDEARAYFEKADKVAPHNILRLENMADLYLRSKMPEKSIEKMKELIKLNLENPDKKFDYYEQILKAGFPDHAQNFCKQTSTSKDLIRYYNNKGVLHSKDGKYREAIEEYKTAEKLLPDSGELYRLLFNQALAHINLKTSEDLKEAETLLNKCLSIKPDFVKAKEKLEILKKFKASHKTVEKAS
ncbi:MAG: response regulator [Oligoflexales bacterium]|nr:response regulator [Oligoflexales bacterium]